MHSIVYFISKKQCSLFVLLKSLFLYHLSMLHIVDMERKFNLLNIFRSIKSCIFHMHDIRMGGSSLAGN